MKGFFKEQQRFTQWWLWLIMLGSILPIFYIFAKGLYIQFFLGQPWGDKPMSDSGLIFMTVFVYATMGGIIWLLYIVELTVEIHDRAVYYSYSPLIGRLKRIGMEDIAAWEVKKISSIGKYGGIGWHKGLGKKTAYIMKGNRGLEIKLKNGRTLMLGTQQPGDIKTAMEYEMEKANNPDYQ